MPIQYCPLTGEMLHLLGDLEGFDVPTWTGPALAAPANTDAVNEVFYVAGRLLAADQSLVQVKDAMSAKTYTLNGVTATGERFMFGDEQHIEAVAGIRALVTAVQAFLQKCGFVHTLEASVLDVARLATTVASWLPHWFVHANTAAPSPVTPTPVDLSTLALEHPEQFSMAWTTLQDVFREGYSQIGKLVDDVFSADKVTDAFWPMFAANALPYNLLVLRKLDSTNVEPFQTNFGSAWTAEMGEFLKAGTLYGIDMTIFNGLQPRQMSDGTTRFTPSTMTLLNMGPDKSLKPVAVYVADPANVTNAQTYTPRDSNWVYALFAVRTSLTVHGIWLGHVYPLHLITGAMLMTMQTSLPAGHRLLQLLGPHSHGTMAFNFLLMVGWDQLAPPTSIANTGEFLTLSAKYAATQDYFANDPPTALAALGLDPAAFTEGGEAWNLYPNAQLIMDLWSWIAAYVHDVVYDLYTTEQELIDDHDLAAWIAAASAADGGNVPGLPRVQTRQILAKVLTSLLYRIVFHGIGRLRNISNPVPSFVPNLPPCLQSSRIPKPDEELDLLAEFLPRTGTLGGQVGFYNLFAFTAPAIPLVPSTGAETELFFDQQKHPTACAAQIRFRQEIERLVRKLQPGWIEIGQWPMCIEF